MKPEARGHLTMLSNDGRIIELLEAEGLAA
jgi:hypothetical protein